MPTMGVEWALSLAGLAAWLYLLSARGGFWRADVRDEENADSEPADWPAVAVVIPARNEADAIATSLASLLRQDYPSPLHVVLVDDQSDDGTAEAAKATASREATAHRLEILSGAPLPAGWTGKLWALKQGVTRARALAPAAKYLLLTDADIAYDQGVLRRLVARSLARRLVLNSLMVKLRCESLAERLLIPAFVFFFQMLYPFAWVNRRNHAMAAAAGGCMLVSADALAKAGGIDAIRSSLIDDCALGRAMKRQGPVWLGLTSSVRSLRPYPHFADVRRMVARSAYDQLDYSPLLLAGTLIGMMLAYLMPPLWALFGTGSVQAMGLATWGLMTLAFLPINRFYGRSLVLSAALPLVASMYMLFTLNSAIQHWRGAGGLWKGRVQARRAEAS